MLIVRTQLKEIVKDYGINNISEGFIDKLEEKVKILITESCNRAKENNRKTLMGKDV